MVEFKSADDAIDELQTISERLSKLNKYEESITTQYKKIDDMINNLEQKMIEEQTKIEEFEKAISQKSEDITNIVDSVEKQINDYGKQIDLFIKNSSKLTDSAKMFDEYVKTMEKLSKSFESFEHQIKEARSIQSQLMIEKLDALLSRAEKLELDPSDQPTGDTKKSK